MNYAGYFDYASATPLDADIFHKMSKYFTEEFYNPSALYMPSERVRSDIDLSRKNVASVLGVKPQEIIFTAGCTEANNIAIHGVMSRFRDATILVSSIEHDSVREISHQYNYKEIPVSAEGILDLDACRTLIDDSVVLVSVMYANNEVGTIQPIRELAKLIAEERSRRGKGDMPIYLHTDAAQAPNYLSCVVSGLGVDLMSLNGGKMYGPKASGCLYVGAHVQLLPLLYGGGQERGIRSGTENVPAIIGFSESLMLAQAHFRGEAHRIESLRNMLLKQIEPISPTILGSIKKRLPNNIHISLSGQDNERLVMELDRAGFCVSTGSACHAKNDETSHVLRAMGISTEDARSSIRITLGKYTTISDVENLARTLTELVAK